LIRDPENQLETTAAKPVLPTKYWFPLLVALVVSGAIFAVSEYSSRSYARARGELGQSMALQSRLIELHRTVLEAESGQRGFLLTRNPEYLEPYKRATANLGPVREQLHAMVAGDKEARDRLAIVDDLVALKVAELERTVERARAGDIDGARSEVEGGEGRSLMARIDQQFAEFEKHNAGVLTARAHRWEDAADSSRSGILAVVGLNAGLIALLALVLIRETRRARENASIQASFAERMKKEVGERTAQLSALSQFLQTQTEAEKARLAGELHDELSRILTPAKMDVNWLEGRCGSDGEIARRLARLSELLDSGIDVKRRIIENLRPSLLDHLGLAPALQWHVEEACKAAELECNLQFNGNLERLSPDLEIALYRVAQEAMTNVIRHAEASRVDVTLDRTHDGIVVSVRDNGVGMADVDAATKHSYGLGSMRQRLSAVGGRLEIHSSVGGGTRVKAFVPQRLSRAIDATVARM
jgi:signal transduction histidine kinase